MYKFHHCSHGRFRGCVGIRVHEEGKDNTYSSHGQLGHFLRTNVSMFGSYDEEEGRGYTDDLLAVHC
jgi:hypothetical protein